MQNPPAKGPTVQKPCTDRADPAFGRVHKKKNLVRSRELESRAL